MMIKAMVMKIDKEKGDMVVMTKDKQFKRLPLPDISPYPGATIEVDLRAKKRSVFNTRWLAVAALLLVFIVGGLSYSQVSLASAYVTLDMEPGLQLEVDGKGKIKNVKSFDSAGAEMIKRLTIERKDVYTVVKDAVYLAGESGYFRRDEENLVIAGITKASINGFDIDENKVRAIIHQELSLQHYPGYVVVHNVDMATLKTAGEMGHSVNKLVILQKVKEHGTNIKPESIKELFPHNSTKVSWPGQLDEVGSTKSNHMLENYKYSDKGYPGMTNQKPSEVEGQTDIIITDDMHNRTTETMPKNNEEMLPLPHFNNDVNDTEHMDSNIRKDS